MRKGKRLETKEILKKIEQSKKILITSHPDPDGDSFCSQLALANFLDSLGKTYEIFNQGEISSKYLFLDEKRRIKNKSLDAYAKTVQNLLSSPKDYDLVITIECSNLDRVGWVKNLIPEDSFLINIDHHRDNTFFGSINYVDPKASATGEMIYDIMKTFGFSFDKKTAELIYVAIMTDTGRFKYSNTTPKSLRVCADLLGYGVDIRFLTEKIYFNFSEPALRLLGATLESLELFAGNKISFLTITYPMLEKFKVPHQDIDGFVEFSLSLEDSKVGALFLETKKGFAQVSLRSCDFMDVCQIAKSFGGGGHKNASGFLSEGKIELVKRKVLDSLLKKLKEKSSSFSKKKMLYKIENQKEKR